MKKSLIYTLFLVLFCLTINGQSSELGITLGGMTYSGELTPSDKIWKLNKIHPTVGILFRYNINDFFAFRANLSHGTISGNDALADTEKRQERNLHFKNNIQELSAMLEFNILRFNPLEARNFTIYGMIGVAGYHHNPKALYEGNWVALQPLGTEGQFLNGNTSSYRLWDLSIPAGGGIKYAVNGRLTIGAEFIGRVPFNDYLDDVSTTYPDQGILLEQMGQTSTDLSNRKDELPHNDPNPVDGRPRGNPTINDYYFSGGVTLTYRLVDSVTKRRKMRQNRNKCPTF